MADNFDQTDSDDVLEKDIRKITNRLTNITIGNKDVQNVTIGEIIDKRKEDNENILQIIKERKQKKQGCDRDTIKNECFKRFGIDTNSFSTSISQLLFNDCISENVRSGKKIYSVNTNVCYENEDSHIDDFIEFKKFISDTVAKLNQKIETQQAEINKFVDIMEVKDTVINILRDEIKNTRDLAKSLLDQNNRLITSKNVSNNQNFSKSQSTDLLNKFHDNSIEDSPVNTSISSVSLEQSSDIKDKLNDQLLAVRIQKHEKFLSETSISVENNTVKTSHIVKQKNVAVEERKSVIVCGDSLLNNIDGKGLSSKKSKVVVRSFPGANSSEMLDYIKPLVNKKPQQMIIHIGTNDLTLKNPTDTIENLDNIRKLVTQHSPQTDLVFSQLLLRDDKVGLENKVKELNRNLRDFCKAYNLHLICHTNIDKQMLSKKKLHLNTKGTSQFAKNFKKYINEN